MTYGSESLEDAISWAEKHGFEKWVLLDKNNTWYMFCRRPDGVVFMVAWHSFNSSFESIYLKSSQNSFVSVATYRLMWKTYISKGMRPR